MLNPELVIKTSNLSKDYKVVIRDPGLRGMMRSFIHPKSTIIHAVKNLNLEIFKGELVGYIGPNGSGKSTTIKMLSGILEPTSGDVQVAGLIPSKERIKTHIISELFLAKGLNFGGTYLFKKHLNCFDIYMIFRLQFTETIFMNLHNY